MAERRQAWDERNKGCCEQPVVWDIDPVMHPCARVPDRVGLDWPPARLGDSPRRIGIIDFAPRLPLRRAGDERARSSERELLVLKGRRGERVSFGGAGQLPGSRRALAKGPAAPTSQSCLVRPWRRNRERETRRRGRKAKVKGAGCNDPSEEKIFDRETPCLDFRGHRAVRPASSCPWLEPILAPGPDWRCHHSAASSSVHCPKVSLSARAACRLRTLA